MIFICKMLLLKINKMKFINKFRTKFVDNLPLIICVPVSLLLLSLIGVFIIVPFYIYRSLIAKYTKLRDSSVTRVLTGLSASLLRDADQHSTKPLSSIVVCLRCRGLSLEQFSDLFNRRILNRRRANGDLQFPELQQHFKQKFGYIFLRWEDEFKLEEHISEYTRPEITSERMLLNIWENLMVKSFKTGKSPWEILFIKNYPCKGKFVVFLRIHHGIADGFSVQKLLRCFDPSYSVEKVEKTTKKDFMKDLSVIWKVPFEIVKFMVFQKEPFHHLHLPVGNHAKEYFVLESDLLPVKYVKHIKNHFRVQFTTILMSMVMGGIARFLEKTKKPFPELHRVGVPFVTGGSGEEMSLENNFLIAPFTVPLHCSSLSRIQNVQEQLISLQKNPVVPKFLSMSINALSCLPVRLMRLIAGKSVFSTAYSTIPGPGKAIVLPENAQLDEVNFTYGTGAASLGLCFSTITYLDKFRITIFVDKNIVSKNYSKVEEINECVMAEYKYMCKMSGILEE